MILFSKLENEYLPIGLKLQDLTRRGLTFMDYSYTTEVSQSAQSYRGGITRLHLYGLFSLVVNTFFVVFFPHCIICFTVWKR